jgi:hypothetical protein
MMDLHMCSVETVQVFANGGDMVAEDGFHMCLVKTVQVFANEGDIVAEDGCACGTYGASLTGVNCVLANSGSPNLSEHL